jgi:hypothetical protein
MGLRGAQANFCKGILKEMNSGVHKSLDIHLCNVVLTIVREITVGIGEFGPVGEILDCKCKAYCCEIHFPFTT